MHLSQQSLWNSIYTHSLAVISTFVGAILVYMALFMYKNDFGNAENLLVKLWVKVDDLAREAPGHTSALIKVLAGVVSSAFDRLFGSKVRSLRAVAVSGALSLLPVYIARSCKEFGNPILGPQFILATLFLFVPIVLLWFSKTTYGAEAIVMCLLAINLTLFLFLTAQGQAFAILAMGFCFAICSDFGLIILNRSGLRWCSREDSPVKMLSLLIVNILLALVSCVLPWMAAGYFDRQYEAALSDPAEQSLAATLVRTQIESTGVASFQPVEQAFNLLKSEIYENLGKRNLSVTSFSFRATPVLHDIGPFVRLCDSTEDEDYQRFYSEEEQNGTTALVGGTLSTTDTAKAEYRTHAAKKVDDRKKLRLASCQDKKTLTKTVPFIQNAIADFRKQITNVEERQRHLREYPIASKNARLLVLTNVDTLGMSVLIIVSMGGMMIHRLVWPILARPLLTLADLGILKSRALLGLIGSSLLGAAPFWEKIFALLKP